MNMRAQRNIRGPRGPKVLEAVVAGQNQVSGAWYSKPTIALIFFNDIMISRSKWLFPSIIGHWEVKHKIAYTDISQMTNIYEYNQQIACLCKIINHHCIKHISCLEIGFLCHTILITQGITLNPNNTQGIDQWFHVLHLIWYLVNSGKNKLNFPHTIWSKSDHAIDFILALCSLIMKEKLMWK